jgi:hypothetical protein
MEVTDTGVLFAQMVDEETKQTQWRVSIMNSYFSNHQ